VGRYVCPTAAPDPLISTDVLKVLDGLAQAIGVVVGVHSTNMVDTLAAELASGRIWKLEDVEAWARKTGRIKPGPSGKDA